MARSVSDNCRMASLSLATSSCCAKLFCTAGLIVSNDVGYSTRCGFRFCVKMVFKQIRYNQVLNFASFRKDGQLFQACSNTSWYRSFFSSASLAYRPTSLKIIPWFCLTCSKNFASLKCYNFIGPVCNLCLNCIKITYMLIRIFCLTHQP